MKTELDITADLALLELTGDERVRLEAEVSRLLDYFATMDSIDVTGLEPTTHALCEGNRLRPDKPATELASRGNAPSAESLADDILEQAPDLEDRFIAIPNVL